MGVTLSLFDAATFVAPLKLFEANAVLFQTGRSRHLPWQANRPALVLVVSSLGALAAALVFGPFSAVFGLVAVPSRLAAAIAIITAAYLTAAGLAKRFELRQMTSSPALSRAANGKKNRIPDA
jgi:P-type Mg2+ transporter